MVAVAVGDGAGAVADALGSGGTTIVGAGLNLRGRLSVGSVDSHRVRQGERVGVGTRRGCCSGHVQLGADLDLVGRVGEERLTVLVEQSHVVERLALCIVGVDIRHGLPLLTSPGGVTEATLSKLLALSLIARRAAATHDNREQVAGPDEPARSAPVRPTTDRDRDGNRYCQQDDADVRARVVVRPQARIAVEIHDAMPAEDGAIVVAAIVIEAAISPTASIARTIHHAGRSCGRNSSVARVHGCSAVCRHVRARAQRTDRTMQHAGRRTIR